MITEHQRIEAERAAAELDAQEAVELTCVPKFTPQTFTPEEPWGVLTDHPSIPVLHADGLEFTHEGTLERLQQLDRSMGR